MHTLSFDAEANRFEFRTTFENKDVPKAAGFYWDKGKELWVTRDAFVAAKLYPYADQDVRLILQDEAKLAQQSFQMSRAADASGLDFVRPKGLDYLPYQKVGINYALTRRNTLIADEMGLGKTIQAIGMINTLSAPMSDGWGEPLRRVLIICPASLKINWLKEMRKWLVSKLTYAIADSKNFPRHHDIVIINYDILGKWADVLKSIDWDLKIADEVHYVKNPDAQRSKNFYPIAAKRKISMSGTPLPNRPEELFAIINDLSPTQFPDKFQFLIRYDGGVQRGKSWDFTGPSNLDELQARLRSTVMIRRLKADVLTDLPPKTRQIIELPVPRGATDLVRREVKEYESQEYQLNAVRAAIAQAKEANDTAAYKAAVDQFRQTSGAIMGQIAELRKLVAIAKMPLVVEHINDIQSDDRERKIIVFAHHHVIMDGLVDAFGKRAVKFSGKESLADRDKAVMRFQNDPTCTVFVGSITAAGVGITLTASSHVIFAELDWVPGNLVQCEDRAHRIGQRDNVLVQHLVLEDSLDYRIATKIVDKQMVIDATLNTEAPAQLSFG